MMLVTVRHRSQSLLRLDFSVCLLCDKLPVAPLKKEVPQITESFSIPFMQDDVLIFKLYPLQHGSFWFGSGTLQGLLADRLP